MIREYGEEILKEFSEIMKLHTKFSTSQLEELLHKIEEQIKELK